jgi:UDP-N-acetyl-D-glucosamine dehydrogenase
MTLRDAVETTFVASTTMNGRPRAQRATRTVIDLTPTTVAVVGLGYVGLPTAIALAGRGCSVTGIDVSTARLGAIGSGAVDLLPSDLDRLADVLADERLRTTADASTLADASAVIICVPTPVDAQLTPDLGPLASACASVVEHARPGQMIVLTSTSYVGTTREHLVEPLERRGLRVGEDLHVAFSPERIDPGNAAFPQEVVPRVVGGVTARCTERASALIARVAPAVYPVSSPEVAELTKLHENTFRAVNIALANEMADLSRALGIEITEVIDAAATKPYGFMPFFPGPGVGGHCIPCDPHYLLWQIRARRVAAPLIEQAMTNIARRPGQVVSRAREVLADAGIPIGRARVAVVGVAYKPGVEDLRESPALEIIESLLDRGAHVDFIDPLVRTLRLHDGSTMATAEPTPEAFDLVIVHTRHPKVDHSWLADCERVLDTTYRLADAANTVTL